MWQSPAARLRVGGKRPDSPQLNYHLIKVSAEIKLQAGLGQQAQIMAASIVLNDISPSGVAAFAEGNLRLGQEIFLTLENPKRFYARGQVISCQNIEVSSKIITLNKPLGYRVGIIFKFDSESDKEEIHKFCAEISGSLYSDSSKAA